MVFFISQFYRLFERFLHEKIYICHATGTKEIKPFVRLISVIVTIYAFIYFINQVVKIDQDYNLIIMLVAFIGLMVHRYARPPRIQIDSFHWFTYIGRIEYHSVQLKKSHYFSMTNQKIILNDHRKKVVSISFLDFENIDLRTFATAVNEMLEKNRNLDQVLSSENKKIQGFSCKIWEGANIHKIYKQNVFETQFFEKAIPIFMLITGLMEIIILSLK